jgi:hypothetical protein
MCDQPSLRETQDPVSDRGSAPSAISPLADVRNLTGRKTGLGGRHTVRTTEIVYVRIAALSDA